MSGIKKLCAVAAVVVGLLLFVNPIFNVNPQAQSVTTPCSGGALVPNFSCSMTAIFNMLNGIQTNGSLFQTATVTLTNAQVIALSSTPVVIIPTPPTGYVHVPIYAMASFNEASTYGGGSDLKLFYTSRTAGNAASGALTFAGFLDTGASNNSIFQGVISGVEPGKTARPVVVQATALTTITGGDTANSLKISVQYLTYATGTLR